MRRVRTAWARAVGGPVAAGTKTAFRRGRSPWDAPPHWANELTSWAADHQEDGRSGPGAVGACASSSQSGGSGDGPGTVGHGRRRRRPARRPPRRRRAGNRAPGESRHQIASPGFPADPAVPPEQGGRPAAKENRSDVPVGRSGGGPDRRGGSARRTAAGGDEALRSLWGLRRVRPSGDEKRRLRRFGARFGSPRTLVLVYSQAGGAFTSPTPRPL